MYPARSRRLLLRRARRSRNRPWQRQAQAAAPVRRTMGTVLNNHLEQSRTPAVVVGLCGHGLAIVRALHQGNMPIFALEASASQPGTRTRLAKVEFVADINGPGLIDALLALRRRLDCPGAPILFLTNDTMVRTIGIGWERLNDAYRLSWSHARESLLPLLEKSALEARCMATGLAYPKTYLLRATSDVGLATHAVNFPIIVKPARPLSRFKTALPATPTDLRELADKFREDLPFLVQQFIPGDDTSIQFCALYLDHGKVLARFDGHKLRSRPLGHTSIAESAVDDKVFEQTCSFFSGLNLSGPVSLELKRDGRGGLWVIEPTVGRTDFWIDLCTTNGVNLPLTEYCHQAGTAAPHALQQDAFVWFNEDRDPLGRLWFMLQRSLRLHGRHSTYLYLHRSDPRPALVAITRIATDLLRSLGRRVGKLFAR